MVKLKNTFITIILFVTAFHFFINGNIFFNYRPLKVLKRFASIFAVFRRFKTKSISEHSALLGKPCGKVDAQNFSLNAPTLEHLVGKHKDVIKGGHWIPHGGFNNTRIAIVIPFKDREEHLLIWLWYMIPFLQEQRVDFTIFVIEQVNNKIMFNKGILYNAGFKEINKLGKYDCFILHDVDLIAENVCNLYQCEENTPVHLSPAVNTLDYDLPYRHLIGGVLAIEPHVYTNINGFTNAYYGWGGEDDELSVRIQARWYTVSRSNSLIGRYTMITHNRTLESMERRQQSAAYHGHKYHKCEGLNSVQYQLRSMEKLPLYTKISIEFSGPKTVQEGQRQYKTQFKALHWNCFR